MIDYVIEHDIKAYNRGHNADVEGSNRITVLLFEMFPAVSFLLYFQDFV